MASPQQRRRPLGAADAENDNNDQDGNTEQRTKREEEEKQQDVVKVSSLLAHRNILFGARCHLERPPPPAVVSNEDNESATATSNNRCLVSNVCLPLVEVALRDAAAEGEQPQALSTLHGLCAWVAAEITALPETTTTAEEDEEAAAAVGSDGSSEQPISSKILASLRARDPVAYEAVEAIATGIPRPGHSVVGAGTFRDGAQGWEELAREFVTAQQRQREEEFFASPRGAITNYNDEFRLYQKAGGELVRIELLADKNPEYLESAGGAMARFFFP